MSVIVAAEPLLAGATLPDPRPRVVTGLAVPMMGAATANAGSRKRPADRDHEHQSGNDQTPETAEEDLPAGAMFVAGLVAAALPERPRSIDELWGRPGTAWVAPESELKLRDFSV